MSSFVKRLDIRISLLYGVIATLWIIFSDTLALRIFGNNHSLEAVINIGKGLGFVLITTLALYFLLSVELRKRARVEHQLEYERDISPVAIMVFNLDGHISYANLQVEKILGQPRSEIIGKHFNSPDWHVTDYDGNPIDVYPLIAQLAQSKLPVFGSQQAIEVVKGHRILLEINLAPIFDSKNIITGVVATFNDVTSAKNLEKRLRESEERFRLLFNNNPLPMIVYDPDTQLIIESNDAVVTQYGYSHAELSKMGAADFRLSDDIPLSIEDTQQKRIERQHRLKNGQIINVEVTSHIIEYADHYAVLAIAQNISRRKLADQALRESEASLKRAQAIAHVGDWSWDSQTGVMHWSDEMYTIFGVNRDISTNDRNQVIKEAIHPDDRELGLQINKAVLSGEKGVWEFRIVRPDGSIRYIQIESGENITDADGKFITVSGIMQDITERKRADQALRESEASLKRAQAVAHVGSWSLDITANTAYASEEAYRIFGVKGDVSKANLNELIIEILHPDDQIMVMNAIGDILNGQKTDVSECRILWPDGSIRHIWVELGEVHRDTNGTILGMSGIVQDITERKQTEKALQESESRYRNLVEQASDAIFTANVDANYIEVNTAACHLLGYTRDELLQKKMLDVFIIPPDQPLRYEELLQGKTLLREREMIRKDGTRVAVEVSSKLLKDGTVQAIARDITERKQAEEELRLKSAALEAAANGIVITNINGIIEWVNPAFAALTGYETVEAEGRNPSDLVRSGQHNEHFYKEMWDTILTGQVWRGELVNRRKNGTLYTEEMTITPVRNESGEIQHFVGIKQDITERKLSEAAIHRLNSELEARVIERTTQLNHIKNRIESILNSNADSIIFSRVDGTIDQINPAFTQTFGYYSDEILFQPLHKLVMPEDVSDLEEVFASVVINRQAQQLDVIATRKSGKTFDAAVLLSPVIEHGDELVGVVLNVHDVTNRNHMLRHAMDLSEIKSRYVSMAAHDLRNPMAVILTSSETLEHYYDKMNAEKKQTKFEQIKASIKVMTDILDDILIMGQAESGKLQFSPALLDVTAFCEMLTAEMVQTTKSAIQIDFSIEGLNQPVMLDAKLLRHILGNLLSNAIKYSPDTSPISFAVHALTDQIVFTIQDQGIGIPKSEQTRLFETFHRASNAKHIRGTGLGLAIVKQSVELHGGSITFESEEGCGSTFVVNLPIAS